MELSNPWLATEKKSTNAAVPINEYPFSTISNIIAEAMYIIYL
jgi:hypothetical protein